MALFKKRSPEEEAALAVYKVTYKGGLPDLPKAKVGEIRLLLLPDELQLHPTIGSTKFWNRLDIPYTDVFAVQIVARQVSTLEAVVGGLDSRQLNQDNNIHIRYADGSGDEITLRFEMLTGVTVQNQAKKCRELEDQLRNVAATRFRGTPAADATAGAGDIADQIAKLAALRDQGILSEQEFAAKKVDLLDRM